MLPPSGGALLTLVAGLGAGTEGGGAPFQAKPPATRVSL